MAQQTSVDVQGMAKAQTDYQNALEYMTSNYLSMSNQKDALVASWVGETAATFEGALSTWLDDFAVVKSQFQTMLDQLNQSQNVYANANEGSQQIAGSFAHSQPSVGGLGI